MGQPLSAGPGLQSRVNAGRGGVRNTMANLALALASAGLLILTFPGPGFAWLAPVALAPLLAAAAREPNPWRRLLLGEAAGIVYWFGVCTWIQFVLSYHGGMGELAGWACFLLFCIAKAAHMAVFTWLAGYVMDRWWTLPAAAALWTGIERTHGPLGFAWMALGNAGIGMDLPMRLAPWVGVYGLSFVFAMTAAALASAALRRPRRRLAWLAVLPALWLLPSLPPPQAGDRELVVMQPNVPLDKRWDAASLQRTVDLLALQTMAAAMEPGAARPELLVWPEVPAPFYYETDPGFRAAAENMARLTGTPFLFGTVAYTDDGSPLNSAQLLDAQGRPVARYDKMFLVPFGEFVPPLFGFINRITKEAGDFVPGREIVLMPVDGRPYGVFICYEAVFPHLVRRFALAGAQVFVNLSNDGYFGPSAARRQHLLIARMRAAENRRWLVRATNNGITAVIDPAGCLRQRFPEDVEMAARLNFGYVQETTFYSRHGDWFAWGCLLAGLLAAASRRFVAVYHRRENK